MDTQEDLNEEGEEPKLKYKIHPNQYPKIAALAKEHLGFNTLDTTMVPEQDSKIVDVWRVRDFSCALFLLAYTAGFAGHKAAVSEKQKKKRREEREKIERQEFRRYMREKKNQNPESNV